MENYRIWIRVKIPAADLQALRRDFPSVEFLLDDGPHEMERIDASFTDDPIPEDMLARMPKLRWLHVTRGGANAYLTPAVKSRPIEVTGSKGIHGRSFSEFALACVFALAKKLPESWENQKKKTWRRVEPGEVEKTNLGIVGLGPVGTDLARKAKALGMQVVATKRTTTEKPPYVDELGGPDLFPRVPPQAGFGLLPPPPVPSTERI